MFIHRSAQLIGNAVANHMALYPPSEPTLAYLQDACRLILHVDWTEDWFQTEIVDIEWDFTAQCSTERSLDREVRDDVDYYPHTTVRVHVEPEFPACRYCGHRSPVHQWYGSAPFCGAQCIDAFETWVAEPF